MSSVVKKKKPVPPALIIPTVKVLEERKELGPELFQVAPSLFISDYQSASSYSTLRVHEITHILNLADIAKCPNVFEEDFQYCSVHLHDHAGANILQIMISALTFIDKAISQGGRVLVHCVRGMSRAPTMACAYLMWKQRLSTGLALRQLRKAQPSIDPNLGFVSQLDEFFNFIKDNPSNTLVTF